MVRDRVGGDHDRGKLHQLRVGSGCKPAPSGMAVQHRHHGTDGRYIHGDILLRIQNHIPGGGSKEIMLSGPECHSGIRCLHMTGALQKQIL